MTTEKEDIYCAEQIKIPSSFPYILKQYAKAAIRTQPYDLLQWTCAYFRALANSEIPPVKVNNLTFSFFFFFFFLFARSFALLQHFLFSFRRGFLRSCSFVSKTISWRKEGGRERNGRKIRMACLISLVCFVGVKRAMLT